MPAIGINRRKFLNNSMIAVGGAWVLGRPASVAQAQVAASGQMPAKPEVAHQVSGVDVLGDIAVVLEPKSDS